MRATHGSADSAQPEQRRRRPTAGRLAQPYRTVALFFATCFAFNVALGQPSEPVWEPVTASDELYREPFRSVGLQPGDRGLLKSVNIIDVVRVERPEFCVNAVCLTFVMGTCTSSNCAWTAILAEKRFHKLKLLTPLLGGAEFFEFPLQRDRKIVVMRSRRSIAVVVDLGLPPPDGERP